MSVIVTGSISSAATLVITIIVRLVMQKRLRQKESAIVTASPPGHYADISEISLREYFFPKVTSNLASASNTHHADDSEITQRKDITEVQSSVVYASSDDYADTSEIDSRVYEIPEVENVVYESANDYADACEISSREYEVPQVSTNVAYARYFQKLRQNCRHRQ